MAIVGVVLTDAEMVRMTLNGFTRPWAPFIKSIVAQKELPDLGKVWDDFIQERIQEESLSKGQHKGDDENLAFAIWQGRSRGKPRRIQVET